MDISRKKDPHRCPYIFLLFTCTMIVVQELSEFLCSSSYQSFSQNIIKIRGFYFLQILSASFIACTIPMIVDALIEFFFDTRSFDFYERIFVLGFSILPNFMLQVTIQPMNYRTYKYVMVLISQDIISSAVVLWLISKFYPSKKKTYIMLAVLLLRGLSLDMQSYSLFIDHPTLKYYAIQELFMWLSSLLFLYHLLDVLRSVSRDSYPWQQLRRGELTEESILCLFYYSFYLVILNFNQVIRYGLFFDWKKSDGYSLSIMIAVNIVAIASLTILPGRIAKLQARFQKQLIELAKRFLRYFSHELKSPLNVIGSGLSVLVEDSSAINLTANSVETLTDVMLSTDKTINLLDNLLQYEVVMNSMKKPEMNWVSLSKVIGTKFTAFETLADKSGILLEIGDPYIVLDTSLIHTRDSTWCNPLSVCMTAKTTTNAVVSQISNNGDNEDCRLDSFNTSHVNNLLCNKDDIFMKVNDHQIERLVHNVMSAAIEHCKRGGVVKVDMRVIEFVHVNESYEKPCGRLCIRISDHGVGQTFSEQMKVFDDISSIVRGELQGGGGIALSLWICCKIALFHEGKLSFVNAESTNDSYIQLELPIYTKSAPNDNNPHNITSRRGLSFTMSTKDPQQFALHPPTMTTQLRTESASHTPRPNPYARINELRSMSTKNSNDECLDDMRLSHRETSGNVIIGIQSHQIIADDRLELLGMTHDISDELSISFSSYNDSPIFDIKDGDNDNDDQRVKSHHSFNHKDYILSTAESQGSMMETSKLIQKVSCESKDDDDFLKSNLVDRHRPIPVVLPTKDTSTIYPVTVDQENSIVIQHAIEPSIVPTKLDTTQMMSTKSFYQKKDHLTFLIVDDSHLNRKVLINLFKRQKDMAGTLTFIEADDGTTAVELVRNRTEPIDCIFLDNTMIKMHGTEAASILRNELQYKGPILGVTGNALPDDVKEFLKSGADSIFIKPITTQKIQEMMRFFMK